MIATSCKKKGEDVNNGGNNGNGGNIVIEEEDFEQYLTGTDYIIFDLGATTLARIESKVALDLRAKGPWDDANASRVVWDWHTPSFSEATGTDAFGVAGEWSSIGNASEWSGIGLWIGSTDARAALQDECEATINTYATLVEGHESEFTLVVIMKCDSEEADPWFSVSGFGKNSAEPNMGQSFKISSAEHEEDEIYTDDGGRKQIHYTHTLRDGEWHAYTINVSALHGFNPDLFYNTEKNAYDSNIFCRGANAGYTCDICAAFMYKAAN